MIHQLFLFLISTDLASTHLLMILDYKNNKLELLLVSSPCSVAIAPQNTLVFLPASSLQIETVTNFIELTFSILNVASTDQFVANDNSFNAS